MVPLGARRNEALKEGAGMIISTTDIVNLLYAKPGRFVEDVAGDELPMREGDDSYIFVSDNGRDYRVTARAEQMEELEKEGYVVTQPGRWVLKAP
jgi:hypothetical protein